MCHLQDEMFKKMWAMKAIKTNFFKKFEGGSISHFVQVASGRLSKDLLVAQCSLRCWIFERLGEGQSGLKKTFPFF